MQFGGRGDLDAIFGQRRWLWSGQTERAERFWHDRYMPYAVRLQAFEMLDGGVKQEIVSR